MPERTKKARKFPTALVIILSIIFSTVQVGSFFFMGTLLVYLISGASNPVINVNPPVVIEKDEESSSETNPFLSEKAQYKLEKIREIIDEVYLFEKVDQDAYDTAVIKGYVDALRDPYTVYYTPEEYDELNSDMEGSYSGIGVVVQQDPATGLIKVVRPYENGPGAEAGILAEDIIYKVNGEEVTGIELDLVVTDIRGPEGTTVDIQVFRPSTGKYIDLTVTRRQLSIEYVTHKMLENNIGYIEMTSFSQVTYRQFMEAFDDLEKQGMEGLIIDIRDNGGGLLDSVTRILDELLPEGIITYTEDRDGNREEYRSGKKCILNIPTAVLVNENSASASEIFTGAMQDYGKARIIGSQTFGKGIVQSIYPLSDGSALKVTISRYFTPKGVCIHGMGIVPDDVVDADSSTEEDEQLDAAVEYIKSCIQ